MKTVSKKNNLLYHYTSISTLLKILDVKEKENLIVYATHAKYFNDPYEYQLAISLLKRSMFRYENEHSIENRKSEKFDKKDVSTFGYIAGYPFILSLSENSDDLTMWRTYGSDGKGIAIGFDKKMLQDYSESKDVKNTKLLRCEYRENAVLKGLTKYWTAVYDGINFNGGKTTLSSFRLLFDITNFCFSFKKSAYKNEKEWRLCKNEMDSKQIDFLERGGIIIPYIKHLFPREIVKKIIVGPCVNKKMTQESIENFLRLRKYTLGKDSILMSKVPYRQV
jgi:hypothetical protein